MATVATTSLAFAVGNELNSSEKEGPPSSAAPPEGKSNFTAVPVAGGTSDIGVGVGFFAALTRNEAGYTPYYWNAEAAGFVSFLPHDGGVLLPYTDVYAKLTINRFLGDALQLDIRPSYTNKLTLNYYGMGNASSATPPPGKSSPRTSSMPACTPS